MKKLILYTLLTCLAGALPAQQVTTGVPFLTVNPDVRSSGMGNAGVAARPDVWSAFTNAARYAFLDEKAGAVFSYTPWMKELVDGQNLYALAAFYRIDPKSAVSVSGRFFTIPEFMFWDHEGNVLGTTTPSEYAVDVAYSRRFSEHFSAALAVRYIHSGIGDQVEGVEELEAAGAVAGDISLYYTSAAKFFGHDGGWRLGLQLANLGSKISAYGADTYLPATLRLGAGADMQLCQNHRVALALDFSRLLVEGNTAFKDNGVLANISGSFGNKAFLKSVVWSVGAEYDWKDMISGRIGYNHESEMYGDRQYFTLGAGGKAFGIALDLSYLFPAAGGDAPYKNTWRAGISYCF